MEKLRLRDTTKRQGMVVLVREILSALCQSTGEDFAAVQASFTRQETVLALSLSLRRLILHATLGKADVGEGAEDGRRLGKVWDCEEGWDGEARDGWSVRRVGDEGTQGEARGIREDSEEGLGDARHWGEGGVTQCD